MILSTHAMSTWFCSQNQVWHPHCSTVRMVVYGPRADTTRASRECCCAHSFALATTVWSPSTTADPFRPMAWTIVTSGWRYPKVRSMKPLRWWRTWHSPPSSSDASLTLQTHRTCFYRSAVRRSLSGNSSLRLLVTSRAQSLGPDEHKWPSTCSTCSTYSTTPPASSSSTVRV
jgi:hypothetical protein